MQQQTGCKVLLAQKAFACYALYPLLAQYISGTAASGLYEARLGKQHFKGEVHVFSPAYNPAEFDELLQYAGHIVFNTPQQAQRFAPRALAAGKVCGLRVNPELSTQPGHAIYDPCAPFSRLGTTAAMLQQAGGLPKGISGLHFHTLCEQNADALAQTLTAVEKHFGSLLHGLQWLNFGGGHHITRADYNLPLLVECIERIQQTYGVQVYLEPGEAVALNAGYLLAGVVDTLHNGMDIAVLDASAACHMPDVLEMPYTPRIVGAGAPKTAPHTYRLAGNTCLAGDVIGDYAFNAPLQAGDKLLFEDMAIYTMVKNNTFNGMPLPDIVLHTQSGEMHLLKSFGYHDFAARL